MGLNLLRSMIMMTAMGGKNTLKNTAWEEARRRRTKESKRLFWGRRRNSRTYKLRLAIKPLLLVAADNRVQYPHFSTSTRGLCHGLPSLFSHSTRFTVK